MELVAQGAGNIASALFRRNSLRQELLQELLQILKTADVLRLPEWYIPLHWSLYLVVLMPYAGMIPMPTIAAILFIVAYNMCQWRTFRRPGQDSS